MITHKVSEMDEFGTNFGLSAAGQQCFACGELLLDPSQMWKGSEGTRIYLHPDCVPDLCAGLLRDAHELCCDNLTAKEYLVEIVAPPVMNAITQMPVQTWTGSEK